MDHRGNQLLRVLGMAFGLAAVVGAVVGQGILRSPGIVAEASGSVAVIVGLWLAGALVATITALPFAELATAIPHAGGPIAYAETAFGRRAGIAMALLMIVMYTATTALLCFVVGEFLVRLGIGGGRIGPGMLGFAALFLFSVVNSAGTRSSGWLQIILSTTKGLVLLGLVIVLFAQPGAAPVLQPQPAGDGWLVFGVAMLVIVGTYNGWADLVIYCEEIQNPGRCIPRALFGGIAGVAALYLLINLAILHVLPPAAIAGSELAAAEATGAIFGPKGDLVFTAFGVLSVAALTNLGVMTNGRLVFAVARSGILPSVLARVDRRGTPMAGMWASSAVSALFLMSGTYLTMSSTAVSLGQAIYVIVIIAALRLRLYRPDLPRPFAMPFFGPLITLALIINCGLLGVFVWQDPANAMLGFGLVAGLWLLYLLVARNGRQAIAPVQIQG